MARMNLEPLPADVKHYFESPEQRAEYLLCLRRGRVPVKYTYMGSAAPLHVAWESLPGSRLFAEDLEAEVGVLSSRISASAGLQLCELGPGAGLHTARLIAALGERGLKVSRYLGLEFSEHLAKLAKTYLSSACRDVDVQLELWDFESAATDTIDRWRRSKNPLLVVWFGQTIGNLYEPLAAVANLRSSLRPGDLVAVTASRRSSHFGQLDYVAPYDNDTFRAGLLEPLLAVGIDSRLGALHTYFDGESVRTIFKLHDNLEFEEFEHIRAGSEVELFVSRRFSPQETRLLLGPGDWSRAEVRATRHINIASAFAS